MGSNTPVNRLSGRSRPSCRRAAIATLAAIWLAAPAVLAQTPAAPEGDVLELSLSAAVQRAVAANPGFEEIEARLGQQQAGVRLLLARLLPNATLTATYNHTDQEVLLGQTVVVEEDSFGLMGDLSLSLFQPRALADYLAADRELDAAEAAAEYSRDTLAMAVVELFVAVDRAHAQLETADAAIARRSTFLDAAELRLEHELADRSEVQRARLSLLAAQAQRDQAESQESLAQEALAVVLDLPPGTRVRPVGDRVPDDGLLADAGSGADAASEGEVGQRGDVESLRLLEERDALARTFTWLDFLPSLGFGASFSQGPSTFRDPDGFSWQIDLRAVFTLYDGGARYGLMDQEAATRVLHEAQRRAAEADAESDLRSARLRIAARERALGTATESLEIAREYWNDASRRRDAGLAGLLDVLDAEQQLSDAELQVRVLDRDLCLEQWRLVHARGDLLQALGE